MIKSNKKWCVVFICFTLIMLILVASITVIVDPYFHYHKPLTDMFFYTLSNERSQNDGIIKHFDYNAIITGTSMTQNFKTSEFDKLFDVTSIKVPFAGATYKELNDNLKTALKYNPDIKIIIRGFDTNRIFLHKDRMRFDLGEYPTYLYDNNPFNDVKYILNKDILLKISLPIVAKALKNSETGITDFDTYSNWNFRYTFGKEAVLKDFNKFTAPATINYITEQEKTDIKENLAQNVLSLAKQYPNTQFYYFFTPYSIVFWAEEYQKGTISRQIEAEKCAIEMMLECDNITLFSFNTDFDIITNLDNYKDSTHYGEWINSYILECMKKGSHILTKDNYLEYIAKMSEFYNNFDYNSLFE